MNNTVIIAEAGVNHNGDINKAYELVDVAVKAGVDVIKFQTFVAEQIVTPQAKKADYQDRNDNSTNSQYEMLKKLEFTFEEFKNIEQYCNKVGIHFCSTAFDFPSISALADNFAMPFWKIPSGEITNLPYLRKIASITKKVILSTGMATIDEIDDALQVFYKAGLTIDDITILHCTTEYPAPKDEINLNAMNTLKKRFNTAIGYSDHTMGIEIPIAAVALGATVIEKHITLDKTMNGPDHKASIEPTELNAMVAAIRNIEGALGNGIKKPTSKELQNAQVARKSIVAQKNITKGDIFTEDNITTKRPGNGITPMKWDDVLGQKANRDFKIDELIVL